MAKIGLPKGFGKRLKVREKSVKSQGILKWILSGNPEFIDLIERTFQREGSPNLACNDKDAFFTSEKPKNDHAWSCQNVCDALTFLLDNIFIQFWYQAV